jgi:hypothetical protein
MFLCKVVSLRPSADSGVFQYLPDPTLLIKASESSIVVPPPPSPSSLLSSSSHPKEVYYYKEDKKDNDVKDLDKIEFDSTCLVKRNRSFYIYFIFFIIFLLLII